MMDHQDEDRETENVQILVHLVEHGIEVLVGTW